ncbi:MAG: LysM peptidoglycan-binding domain-containing protein, partial [Clostridia bacterium]|nr:LysM peptidoglycan-binding domain-containing protein [Clostridia bacterium]
QMLKIPAMKNCEMPGFTCYKVKSGDSLWSIGQKFGVSWRKIAVINKIANPSNLQPGTVLSIPTDGNLAPSQQVNTLDVGDHVRIKSDAMYYYAGRRIPDWVKTDYTYYVAAVLYNGKPVYLGDKRSVLLGKRQNNMTGVIEPGFNTWVNEDILEKV